MMTYCIGGGNKVVVVVVVAVAAVKDAKVLLDYRCEAQNQFF